MSFNFDLNNTKVLRAVKNERVPIFMFAKFFTNISLFLFILSLCFVALSFIGLGSAYISIKIAALILAIFLFFWNLSLFTELKIKKPSPSENFLDAIDFPEKYNIAEFLNFSAAKIVNDSVIFCQKRKITVNSASLFYSAIKTSKEIALISFRLGLDIEKLRDDLKNYLEKTQKQPFNPGQDGHFFQEDFQKTILESLKFAKELGHKSIGEKEIFVGLARSDEFFKKIMIDYDLKELDVENLVKWLNSAENLAKKSKQFWSKENLARQGSVGKNWASGYTVNLDKYSIDWSRSVGGWACREIIGHKKEIEEIEMILARSNQANALIVGEPGTGRKSIVHALAQKCNLGVSLGDLNNKRVVELDLVSLIAQIQNPEKLEAILDQIFSETLAAGNVILVIDELQNFVGQKENRPGQVDISGILSKYLAIPSFQFIAITDFAGLHRNIEAMPSFVDFFRIVEVTEITEDEIIQILQSAALDFEYKNKVLIIYPSIREVINLTARYMPSLPFPKKALDVLDEVVVYIQTLKEKIVFPHHVAKIISQKTDIPVGKMETKEKETLMNLESLIHNRIVNQSEAVTEISIAMRRARVGIGSKNRPMGSFLFMGPTGVGKTETAKALAQIYFGSEEKMIRLDMSEFQAIADIQRLIGSVSPVEMQGLLTTPVRERPFSLLLLDEIEKAHPNILNLFLQVLDEGHITDGQGRKVVFTNTIIIFTSNAGADIIFKELTTGKLTEKESFLNALIERGTFKPELINRFDATVIFHPLSRDNLLQISQLILNGLQKNLKEKEIDFEITEVLKEKIVELSYKPEFGAREMKRVVQSNVENSIAQALLADKIKKGDSIKIDPENFSVIINPVDA